MIQGKSLEDLERELGEDTGPEGEAKPAFVPFILSKQDIAEIAYDASIPFQVRVSQYENEVEPEYWDGLSEEEQGEYVEIAYLALRMQKESDEEFARIVHSKRAMQYLTKGYTFSEKHEPESQKTWMVAPFDSLPQERRVGLITFRAFVRALLKIWDQDNPYFAKN